MALRFQLILWFILPVYIASYIANVTILQLHVRVVLTRYIMEP